MTLLLMCAYDGSVVIFCLLHWVIIGYVPRNETLIIRMIIFSVIYLSGTLIKEFVSAHTLFNNYVYHDDFSLLQHYIKCDDVQVKGAAAF